MSLSLFPTQRAGITRATRPSAPVLRGRSMAPVALVAGVPALAALTGLAQLGESSLSTTSAFVVIVVAVVALLYLVTRDSRRRRARTKKALAWIARLHLGGSPAGDVELFTHAHGASFDSTPSPQVRSLQLHVRTLEAALEEQTSQLMQARQHIEERRTAEIERVLVTIGALRSRIGDEPDGNRVLDRVEAAVHRLSQPTSSTRPALTVHRTSQLTHRLPVDVDARVGPTAAAAATQTVSQEQPLVPTHAPLVEEPVLPVPAPQCDFAPSRRRRLRRSVA